MKLEDLFESPERTWPTDFNLKNRPYNIKVTKQWLRKKNKQPLESFENGMYTLYEMPRSYILVNNKDPNAPFMVYMMQYQVNFHNRAWGPAAQQVAVWRDPFEKISRGVTERIFFDYLLQNYHTVITDSMQTPDGERFWEYRIGDAFDRTGVYVYYVSFIAPKEIIEIKNDQQLRDIANNKQIWGEAHANQARRIIITTKQLDERILTQE